MINDFFLLAVMAAVLFKIDWRLALDTLAVLPCILVVTFVFRHYVRDANRNIRTAIARINSFLQEYISGMGIVQLFNREQKARAEFAKRNQENMVAWRSAILSYALFYPGVEILSVAAIALIYWSGGNRVLAGALSLGVLTEFTMFATRFFRPIQDLSEKFNILQSAMAASERIFKLLDEPATVSSPPDAIRLENPRGEIEFRNVWFSYRPIPNPGEDDWVLRDVSFRVEPGQTLAIVGHTGAGKTTLISLLLRFYDVQRGQILLDGIDIRKINLQDLRRQFGIVPRIPSSSPAPSNPTSASALRTSTAPLWKTPSAKSASPISSNRSPRASAPASTSAAPLSPSASASSSISPVPSRTIRTSSSSTKPLPAWTRKPSC
jgi:ATP-binding cassette subfamily B protein